MAYIFNVLRVSFDSQFWKYIMKYNVYVFSFIIDILLKK